MWSAALASLAILSVVRARALEPLFGGLDMAVRLHRKLGLTALLLLIVHIALLVADAVAQGASLAALLVPFWSVDERSIDILAFYVLIGLEFLPTIVASAMSLARATSRDRVVVPARYAPRDDAAGHDPAIRAPPDLDRYCFADRYDRLGLSRSALLAVRAALPYRVESVVPRGAGIVDLVMRPLERRMMCEPGTFVFIRVPSLKGRERELHPFSVSSSPLQRHLRVSIRQIGDFTRQISYLSLGDDNPDYWKARRPGKLHAASTLRRAEIDVFGPFGGFTPFRFQQHQRMVWVGAGIGITPFLSMLAFERSTLGFRQISLYYVARTAEDAVYDREIREHRSQTSDTIDYALWQTREQGRLTATRIAADMARDDYAVMLCGTMPFVEALVPVPRARRTGRKDHHRGASVSPRLRRASRFPQRTDES